jgi:hypothetical protein
MQKRGRDLISFFSLPSCRLGDKQVDNKTQKVRIIIILTCSSVAALYIAIRRKHHADLVVLFAEHTRTHRTHIVKLMLVHGSHSACTQVRVEGKWSESSWFTQFICAFLCSTCCEIVPARSCLLDVSLPLTLRRNTQVIRTKALRRDVYKVNLLEEILTAHRRPRVQVCRWVSVMTAQP